MISVICDKDNVICETKLDYQPLFGKGARTPPLGGTWNGLERAAEIEPM